MIRILQLFSLIFLFICGSFFTSKSQNPNNWRRSFIPRGRVINAVKVFDVNNIIVFGGNESNDSIISIFRTSDRGENWDFILDLPEIAWLKDAYFPTSAVGYAVGWTGKILKTTDAGHFWSEQHATGNVTNRSFNGVYFTSEQIGYIVGGNQHNDSLQTIIKTTDGGNTWTTQYDRFGNWLNAVYFTSADNGIAVGDNGVVLQTIDGGINWNSIIIAGNAGTRNFTKVTFINSLTGFIVGGNTMNDSIRTILKTTDGGISWNIIQDNLGNKAHAIDFPTPTNGILVGDKGDVLTTADAGITWNKLPIADSINDENDFAAVDFLNIDFGIAAGKGGKILIYENNIPTAPTCNTGNAVIYNSDSVDLFASVNANGALTTVEFEYGLTPAFGNTINANPVNINSTIVENVAATINNLASGLYYYRVKATNLGGVSLGAIKQFYIGANPIPNFDFELWQTKITDNLDDWNHIGAIYKSVSYDGSSAVKITAWENNENTSAVIAGTIGDNGPGDGVPFSARPDSIVGYFRHQLKTGFDGLGILLMIKNGTVFSRNVFVFKDSTNGQFIRKSFPITYPDATIVPDSIILGFSNNDFLAEISDSTNVLEVDNISFIGTTQNVPDPHFENWSLKSEEEPVSWFTADKRNGAGSTPKIAKSSDALKNQYAIQLRNYVSDNRPGFISTSFSGNEKPSFPVNAKFDALYGYHKFYKDKNDTALIKVVMYNHGNNIGSGELLLTNSDTAYTPFHCPISYAQNLIPDSSFIEIKVNKSDDFTLGNSILLIDALSFDGLLFSEIPTAIISNSIVPKVLQLYPNPATNFITVKLPHYEKIKSIEIVDVNGKPIYAEQIFNAYEDAKMFNTTTFSNGMYFVRIQTTDELYINKFIKQ